jgi:CYTH domain-containing protein
MLNDKEYGKYALVERERRFLLRDLPEGLTRASEHVQIWDNYITGTRLRLRQIRVPATKERRWKLTQKYAPAPPDFSRAVITNMYLSPQEYETFGVFAGNEIRKNRYPFEHEGRKYGIDMFLGPLWGLVLAETSFETDEEMDGLSVPPFAVAEVSRDEMFTGGKLAYLTIEDLQAHLSKRGSQDANSSQSPAQDSSQKS